MDKPARRVVAIGQTRPEQPEAPPFLVLDPVIVADRVGRAGACPAATILRRSAPARRPASDPMPAPPPGETKRRVIGQQPERLDRLRRLEQPDRPRWFSAVPLTRPSLRAAVGTLSGTAGEEAEPPPDPPLRRRVRG